MDSRSRPHTSKIDAMLLEILKNTADGMYENDQVKMMNTNPIAVFGFKAFSLNFILQGSWNAFSSVQGGELQQLAGSQG